MFDTKTPIVIDPFFKFQFVIVVREKKDPEPILLGRIVWAESRSQAYSSLRDLFRDENVVAIIEGGA